ncbi:MAG TPA: T9SS type A sorting domain-containing protein [Chitinophagaceae bacterium]|jgi:hypothetical protein|nr:T9SS type A sorting domain-containing protein [Chitinophagaceae bacterium]
MKRRQLMPSLLPTKTILSIAVICLSGSKLHASDNANEIFISKKTFEDDKKPAKKEKSFRNQNVVKVYPDIMKKEMHVIAKSGIEKEIEFMVFDINGNMVLNYKMKPGEKRKITELKKGSYMYHVFAEDEYLTTGKIVFR